MAELGAHGARVLRALTVGGQKVLPGTVLGADTLAGFSLANLKALKNQGKLEMFAAPAPEAPGSDGPELLPAPDESKLDPKLGKFGGVVLVKLQASGVEYPAGAYLPPALCLSWKLKNRHALQNRGRVAFFGEKPTGEMADQIAEQDTALAKTLLS